MAHVLAYGLMALAFAPLDEPDWLRLGRLHQWIVTHVASVYSTQIKTIMLAPKKSHVLIRNQTCGKLPSSKNKVGLSLDQYVIGWHVCQYMHVIVACNHSRHSNKR